MKRIQLRPGTVIHVDGVPCELREWALIETAEGNAERVIESQVNAPPIPQTSADAPTGQAVAPRSPTMPPVEVGDVVRWTGQDGTERSEAITSTLVEWLNTTRRESRFHTIERNARVIWERQDPH